MKVLLIYDGENKTKTSEALHNSLKEQFLLKEIKIEEYEITRDNIKSCMGCFGCWIKSPGECVIKDSLNSINRAYINSDLTIYLTPIIFGQYGSNIKNVLDRFIPTVLPFFEKKNNTTSHPRRYDRYPKQVLIGYGEELTKEETDTFNTLTGGKYSKTYDKVYLSLSEKENEAIANEIVSL